ncbi:MAG TPA: hypothetical protein VMH91_04380 [Candidatus Paceibacterota bacterium]|nr:hypothetical protein [Candidatus Paceibacterota bacterium]
MEQMPNRRDILKGIAGIGAAAFAAQRLDAVAGKEDLAQELRDELKKVETLRDQYLEAQKNGDRAAQERLDHEIGEAIKKTLDLNKRMEPK